MKTETEISPEGVVTKFHRDGDGNVFIETVQDLEPVFEMNKVIAENPWNSDKTFKHVASVPVVFVRELQRMGINFFDKNDTPKVMAMLDDIDYQKFRTGGGRLV